MSFFDNVFTELAKVKPKPKYVTRIHIFFEGAVSEQEIVSLIREEFSKGENILSFVEISSNKATNSILKIGRILDSKWYENIDKKTTKIQDGEITLFLFDADVFFPGLSSLENKKIVTHLDMLKELFNKNLIWIASFPCFEYGLALSLTNSLADNIILNTIDKKEIKSFLSQIAGKKFKKYDKSYKKIFYDTGKFEVSNLKTNALADRQNKNLPLTHTDFANMIKEDKLLANLKNDCPFSYLDYLFITIENKIKEVIENSDK